MTDFPLPILGFCAYSGTGKTTLLTRLVKILKNEGIRVGVVKHAHCNFEIDHQGKDSYHLREAGASQMLVASRRRTALIEEHPNPEAEPRLAEVLPLLKTEELDLILVEGFKREAISKIELQRAALKRPLIYPQDPNVIAIATDYELTAGDHPTQLDINDHPQIARFIQEWMTGQTASGLRTYPRAVYSRV